MATRPNPIPVLCRLLEEDQNVIDLCSDRIFGGKIPADYVNMMPVCAVVLSRAGGFQDALEVPEHSYRIQATCYGGGGGTDMSDELLASMVSSAVTDALVKPDRGRIVDNSVLIHAILHTGGPTQVKDIDMNNTPAEVVFFRVMMPTVALVAPF